MDDAVVSCDGMASSRPIGVAQNFLVGGPPANTLGISLELNEMDLRFETKNNGNESHGEVRDDVHGEGRRGWHRIVRITRGGVGY
eukprot:6275423-Pyramimonas_sp.AAC.1